MTLWERPGRRIDQGSTRFAHLLPAPTALTVDVEGAELLVMEGAGGVLAWHRADGVESPSTPTSWATTGVTEVLVRFSGRTRLLWETPVPRSDHEEHWLFWPSERYL